MKKNGRVVTILAVLLAMLSAVSCDRLRARDQLNKGVQSYKDARYEEAIEHFKNAVQLDPSLMNAKLYLATAYMQQYIPGADSPENNAELQRLMRLSLAAKFAPDRILRDYAALLERAPTFAEAYNQRAILYFRLGDLRRAIQDCERALDAMEEVLTPAAVGGVY